MRTQELAEHLGVTYRQLDYLTRRDGAVVTNADLGAHGSGTRRRWPAGVVARLEIAAALAGVGPTAGPPSSAGSTLPFPLMADAVLAWGGDVPMAGWVLLTEGQTIEIAADLADLGPSITAAGGGVVTRFELTDAVLHALAEDELVGA